MELSSHKLQKLLYFRRELAKLRKQKKICSEGISYVLRKGKSLILFRCVLNTSTIVIKVFYNQ